MRIALICDPIDLDQKTGIPVYCEKLVEEFKRDKENEYVFFHMKENSFFDGFEQVVLPSSADSFLNALRMVYKKFVLMPLELRRKNVDIVHELNLIGPHTFDFFRKYKAVVTVHDLTPLLFPKYHSLLNVIGFWFFGRLSCLTADRVIANSEATKADIVKHFKIAPEKIDVTLLGTDIASRPEDSSLHFDFPFILSVGTIEPRKNLERLVRAFEMLKKNPSFVGVKLVLTGKKGWKMDDFFAKLSLPSELSNDIVFTGFVSDAQLVHLYKTCKVFAYPSLYEGFGLPVLEAMALGAPVVTSNVSSLPEVAGDVGALVDPYSTEDISNGLLTAFIHDKYFGDTIQKGFVRSGLFNWNDCALLTIVSYKKLFLS